MNVVTFYLYGLSIYGSIDDIFMKISEGLKMSKMYKYSCLIKFQKSLCRLKQSKRMW